MSFNKPLIAYVAIATAALLSAGSVFAQEATPDTWMGAGTGAMTRAEVSSDLASARKSGLTKSWSAGYIEPMKSTQPRDQVKADAQRAQASGEIKAINAEAYSFKPAAPQRITVAAR